LRQVSVVHKVSRITSQSEHRQRNSVNNKHHHAATTLQLNSVSSVDTGLTTPSHS